MYYNGPLLYLNVWMHDLFLWRTQNLDVWLVIFCVCWRNLSSNGSYSNGSATHSSDTVNFSSQTLSDYSSAHLLIVSLFARVFEWDVSVCLLSAHKCVAYITDSSLETRFPPHTAHMWSGILTEGDSHAFSVRCAPYSKNQYFLKYIFFSYLKNIFNAVF